MQNWIVPAIVLALATVVLASVLLARRRRSLWRAFAIRHGLRHGHDESGHPRVRGRIGDREFELAVSPSSSDTDVAGVQVETMSLDLGEDAPRGLLVRPRLAGEGPGLASRLEGDALKEHVHVHAPNAPETLRWLEGDRARALDRFLAEDERDDAGIEGGRLFRRTRRAVTRLPDLERRLYSLLRTARALAGDEGRPGGP